MEWFIIGFFLYVIMLSISNWIAIRKIINTSDVKLFYQLLGYLVIDIFTIIVFTISIRKICFTLITLNIL